MREILLTLLLCLIVSSVAASSEDSIQICILSQEEVQVSVAGEIVIPNSVGKQLEKINADQNASIVLIHSLGMEDETIKVVLHSIIDAGYYTVMTLNK